MDYFYNYVFRVETYSCPTTAVVAPPQPAETETLHEPQPDEHQPEPQPNEHPQLDPEALETNE
jgi:hypothetical protein